MPRHFPHLLDFTPAELLDMLDTAARLKERRARGVHDRLFEGRTLAMYFEKPSLRTRVSLEVAAASLGGHAINLEAPEPGALWKRETIADQARVVSRMADIISIRTFGHEVYEEFARHSRVPVINVLTDWAHPTQALADVLTLRERWGGELAGRTLAYIGDGNNMARSLLEACGRLGMRFVHTGPEPYGLPGEDYARAAAACPGLEAKFDPDPARAVREADCLYTDVWASMGRKEEAEARRKVFAPYQLDETLLAKAPARAVVLHCLPAVRGEEITDGVMDHPERSLVFDQSENRLHAYRGLIPWLLGDRNA